MSHGYQGVDLQTLGRSMLERPMLICPALWVHQSGECGHV